MRSSRTAQTIDFTARRMIVSGLNAFTSYNCCVTARYTDTTENAFACAVTNTREGSKSTDMS